MVTTSINHARRLALYVCAAFLPLLVGPVQVAVLLLVALLVAERLWGRRPLSQRGLDVAAALYLVAIAVSFIGPGRLPTSPLAFAFWPMAAWACVARIDWARLGPRTLPRLLAVHLAAATAVGVLAMLQYRYGAAFRPAGPGFPAPIMPAPGVPGRFTANGLMGDRVDLGIAQLLPVLAGTAVAVSPGAARRRAPALGAAGFAAAGVVVTYLRAAWIAGVVALVVTVLVARGRRAAVAVAVVLLAVGAVLGTALPGVRSRAVSAVVVSENADRTSMWERTLALAAEHPVQGIGYGRYAAATRQRFGPPPPGLPAHRGPHDIYLQAAVEMGPLGVVALLFLLGSALAVGFRAAKGAHPGSTRRIAGAVATGTVTAVAVTGLFHDVLNIGQVSFTLWIVVGLAESLRSDHPEDLPERRENDARILPGDLVPGVLGTAAAFVLRALGATWRLESTGRAPAHSPFVLVGWHQGLFIGAYVLRDRGLWFPVSLSRDGDLAEHALRRLGFARSPRGSNSRGGSALLREMIRRVRAGESGGVLPDGPRGPAFEVKPGVLALAAASGVPLVPLGVAAAPVARLTSWDRAIVPLPFARVRVVYGVPFEVPNDASAAQLEDCRQQLTRSLHCVDREAGEFLQRL